MNTLQCWFSSRWDILCFNNELSRQLLHIKCTTLCRTCARGSKEFALPPCSSSADSEWLQLCISQQCISQQCYLGVKVSLSGCYYSLATALPTPDSAWLDRRGRGNKNTFEKDKSSHRFSSFLNLASVERKRFFFVLFFKGFHSTAWNSHKSGHTEQ